MDLLSKLFYWKKSVDLAKSGETTLLSENTPVDSLPFAKKVHFQEAIRLFNYEKGH